MRRRGRKPTLYDYGLPPLCVSCGEPILPSSLKQMGQGALCGSCLLRWNREKICGGDFRAIENGCENDCALPNLWLSVYRKDQESVTRSLILRAKEDPSFWLDAFLADELAASLRKYLRLRGGNWGLTYVPRSPEAIRRYGFDQMREIAKILAKNLEIPCRVLLRHHSHGGQQKMLSAIQRQKNAQNIYDLARFSRPEPGSRLLLIDDVVTTGESMRRCRDLLYAAGASEVFCASIGKTQKSSAMDENPYALKGGA